MQACSKRNDTQVKEAGTAWDGCCVISVPSVLIAVKQRMQECLQSCEVTRIGRKTDLSPKVSSPMADSFTEWTSLEASWWAFACSSFTALARLDSTASAKEAQPLVQGNSYTI